MTITYQLGISLVALIAGLTIFQSVATMVDNHLYQPIEKLVDIGGEMQNLRSGANIAIGYLVINLNRIITIYVRKEALFSSHRRDRKFNGIIFEK